jgi:diguanylate cyclase (GGDEF)-like protein
MRRVNYRVGLEAMVHTDTASGDAPDAAHQSGILEAPAEKSFDRMLRLAETALCTPIVLMSFGGRHHQWLQSSKRLDPVTDPRFTLLCDYAFEKNDFCVVSNTLEHPAFHDNPLVVGEPNIRSYASVPLRRQNGLKVGAICAVDHKERDFTKDQLDLLGDLAQLMVEQIELRQIATTDSLTGALTRRAFEAEVTREYRRNSRYQRDLSVIVVDVDHFKKINDNYGHAAGDLVLKNVVLQIKQNLREMDFLGRLGGEEFVVGLPETGLDGASIAAERLRETIASMAMVSNGDRIGVTASFGIAALSRADRDWKEMVARADVALYRAKQEGRNRCICHQPELELF